MSFRRWQLFTFLLTYAAYCLHYGTWFPLLMLGFWLTWIMDTIIFYIPVLIIVSIATGIFKLVRVDREQHSAR